MAVTFSYADRALKLEGKRRLRKFIESLFFSEGTSLDYLNYVFCSDEYLLKINQEFLHHDYYTDIITFDLRSTGSDAVAGEVYISCDRVADNSRQLGSSAREEMLRVIFHGALHLCGYKDKTKREIALMRQKEEHYLRLYQSTNT